MNITKQIMIAATLVISFSSQAEKPDFESLDWAKICTEAKPVSYKQCKVVHPASLVFSKNPSLRQNNPEKKTNCRKLEARYETYIKQAGGSWVLCKTKYRLAYENRATNSQFFDETLDVWTEKNLGVRSLIK